MPNEELTSGGLTAKALRKAQNNVNCDIGQKTPVSAVSVERLVSHFFRCYMSKYVFLVDYVVK